MNNQEKLKKVLTLTDAFAFIIIIIGVLVAFFLEEIAMRMIGVSISILGAVALFMSVAQKMNALVEPKFSGPKNKNEYKMTVKKNDQATRQTVEDFASNQDEDNVITATVDNINEESEMRIIGTLEKDSSEKKVDTSFSKTYNYQDNFSDGTSGMRIVRKYKPEPIDQKKPDIIEKEIKTDLTEKLNIEDNENIQNVSFSNSNIVAQVHEIVEVNEINKINETQEKSSEPEIQEELIYESANTLFDHIEQSVVQEEVQSVLDEIKEVIEQKIEEKANKNYKDLKIDIPISVLNEVDPLIGDEPRKQFEYFMSRILMIIRSVTNTRTAVFVLNDNGQDYILDSFATNVPNSIAKKVKYPIEHDIVSQIFINAKPEILTDINPAAELDLIPYYSEAVGTVSFIGVPVFQNEQVIGVLCADSIESDAYNSWTVNFLGHFSKLISALVQNFSRQFDLLQTAKTLEALNIFYNVAANSTYGNENLSEAIIESVDKLFETSKIGIVGFNGKDQTWVIKSTKPQNSNEIGKVLDVTKVLIGQTIYECQVYNKLNSELKDVVRIYPGERFNDNTYFISVPILSPTSVYGAIYIETKAGINFTQFDINLLKIIAEHAGNAVEKLHFMEMFHSSQIVDPATGLLNPHAFYQRIIEEFNRSKDFKTHVSLCMVKLDSYLSADPVKFPNRFAHATFNSINVMKKYLKPYDIIGKIDDETFGILFIGKDSNQSKLVFEKARNEIANTILKVDDAKFNITVSAGISCVDKTSHVDELIKNANVVLNKSLAKSNAITVFN